MIPLLLQMATLLLSVAPQALHRDPCVASTSGRLVPTDFVGNRVFALWHLKGHGDLRLYTDTGGGAVSLYPDAVRRIGAPVDTTRWARGAAHGEMLVATIPTADGDPAFPPIPVRDSLSFKFLVQNNEPRPDEEPGFAWDGRLGAAWFLGSVWTFDYPKHRLYFNGNAPAGPSDSTCWVPIGFQHDSTGRRTNVFPRIAARVDGETIQFLLDTGARTEITASAWSQVEPQAPKHRAASFISAIRFRQWQVEHPDWLVVPHAEVGTDSSAMIRVPVIEVGGQRIGPVWFTERPTRSFLGFMSQYTDLPVEGALGGSAWRYVTLIVDYPRSRAAVILPSGK